MTLAQLGPYYKQLHPNLKVTVKFWQDTNFHASILKGDTLLLHVYSKKFRSIQHVIDDYLDNYYETD